MNKLIFALTTLLLFCALSAFGQGRRALMGKVVRADGNRPLVGAIVKGDDDSFTAVTDNSGVWRATIQSGKGTQILVSCSGYEPKRINVGSDQNNIRVTLRAQKPEAKGGVNRLDVLKITLSHENMPLVAIFREIQRQTGLNFVYNSIEVEKFFASTLSYDVNNESVKSFLDRLFLNTMIRYELTGTDVIVLRVLDPKSVFTQIQGRVQDNQRNPVGFASVLVKGSTQGVSTNAAGEFNITVCKAEKPTLVFSFLGYERHEVAINENTPDFITATLKGTSQNIGEVVVTGYERVDKRRMTGSVVSVRGEDVLESTGLTIDKMLTGKLAGVQVTQNTSTPGAAPKIRIRGTSSIMGNREPVWVVDGIVMEDPVKVSSADLNSMDKINLVGNAISFLNPVDIERIDVLKDVSATAIYGVKAANGVVVVTTKRGKMGAPSFTYSTDLSIKTRPSYRTSNLMNSSERIDVSEEIARRGLLYTGGGITEPNVAYEGLLQDLWGKKISYDEFVSGVNGMRRQNTDWFGELMRTSFSQNHNVSLSGGSDRVRYYTSMSYGNDQDAQKNTGMERYTANMNLDLQLAKRLKLTFGLTGAISQGERTHSSVDLMGYAYNTARTINARDKEGLYFYPLSVFDPGSAGERQYIGYNIFNEMEHSWQEERAHTLNMNVNLTYDILESLKFNAIFGYGMSASNIESVADDQSYYISERRGVPYGVPIPDDAAFRNKMDLPYGGELKTLNAEQGTYNIRPTLNFNKNFSLHSVEFQGGMEVRSSRYLSSDYTQWGYLPDRGKKFVDIDLSQFALYRSRVEKNHPILRDNISNTMSIFAIARYTWNNRYTANFNVRYDGSNRFGRDRSARFLPVWSVSGRWNIANETFMRDVDFVDALSLKGSYGAQGNVVDGQTPYMVINQGNYVPNTNQYLSTLDSYPNPKLRWEKTMSWQLGLDFSLWQGRLSGSLEYYSKVGRDQVVTKMLPLSTGADVVIMNGGSLWNKGWEVGLSAVLVSTRDWRWDATFNISRNTNRIENTESEGMNTYSSYLDGSVIINNQSINSFYSYRFDGLDINGLPTYKGLALLDDNGVPASTFEQAIALSMVRTGQRDPKVSGGFTTGVRFKQFSFNMNFSYALGHHVRLNKLYQDSGQQLPMPQQNWSAEFVGRWKESGDELRTNIPVLSDKTLKLNELGNNKFVIGDNYWQMYNQSDMRVVKGDHLRCTSMTLNYRFGPALCNYIRAKNLSVGVSANNVFLIADSRLNGQDPEMANSTRTLPPLPTFSFSLNVTF